MFHVLNVYLECLFQNKSFIFEQIKYYRILSIGLSWLQFGMSSNPWVNNLSTYYTFFFAAINLYMNNNKVVTVVLLNRP